MNLYVNEKECTGCEYCADRMPELFSMNENGICVPGSAEGIPEKDIRSIIDNCPAGCIIWK